MQNKKFLPLPYALHPKQGFTLLELLVVIVIIGILVALISGNFINSLKKGRDARRKTDIQNIQKAVELYYEDNARYPTEVQLDFGGELCHTTGCSPPAGKLYMQSVPKDANGSFQYVYDTDSGGTYYKLYSCIENAEDAGSGVKLNNGVQDPNGYSGTDCDCGGFSQACKFGVSSGNTNP